MKELIENIKNKESELSKSRKIVIEYIKENFNCEVYMSEMHARINNDMYEFHIWFLNDIKEIKQNGCGEVPDTKEEAIAKFKQKKILLDEISLCRDYMIEILKDKS